MLTFRPMPWDQRIHQDGTRWGMEGNPGKNSHFPGSSHCKDHPSTERKGNQGKPDASASQPPVNTKGKGKGSTERSSSQSATDLKAREKEGRRESPL